MHPLHKQTQADVEYLRGLIPLLHGVPSNYTFQSTIDPNYQPDSHCIYVLVIAVILFSLTSTIVCLRFWLRWRIQFGLDDITMIPAFISYCLFATNNLFAAFVTGFGYHLLDLSHEDIHSFFIAEWLHTILWATTLYLTRISILHLLLRLTPLSSTKSRIYLWTVIGASYAYIVLNLIIFFVECHPLRDTFDLKSRVSGKCLGGDRLTLYGALCAGHIVLDLFTIIPPMIVITRMKMARSKKLNLFFLMGLGVVSIIVTAIRTFVFFRQYIAHWDYTYNGLAVGLCAVTESSIAVTIACLPAVNQYLRHQVLEIMKRFGRVRQPNSDLEHGPHVPTIGKTPIRGPRRQGGQSMNTTIPNESSCGTYIEVESVKSGEPDASYLKDDGIVLSTIAVPGDERPQQDR